MTNPTARFYTMTVSLPDKALSPNARVHWSEKNRASRNARIASEMITRQSIGRDDAPMWKQAYIHPVAFLRKGRMNPDPDNFIASLKPIIDGFQDAGLILNDRGIIMVPPMFLAEVRGEELKVIVKRA